MLSRRGSLTIFAAAVLRGQDQTKMFGDAEAYQRFMGRWSNLVAPLLVDFADIGDAGRVLDIGSGTGSLAFAIAGSKPDCQVVGIDPSREYVGYANSRNPFPARVSFQVGDAQQLAFPNASFEGSLSLLVLNFIPDPGKALREMVRVTQPGRRVAGAVWDYGSGMRMLRIFFDAAIKVDPRAERLDEKHMPLCRAGELPRLWRQYGLGDIEEKPLEVTTRFASLADYWDPFLLGQGPAGAYVRSLEPDRRQRLLDELRRRLPLSAEDAPFSLPARVWAVKGTVR